MNKGKVAEVMPSNGPISLACNCAFFDGITDEHIQILNEY